MRYHVYEVVSFSVSQGQLRARWFIARLVKEMDAFSQEIDGKLRC